MKQSLKKNMFEKQLRFGVISCQVQRSPLGYLPVFPGLKARSTPHGALTYTEDPGYGRGVPF